MASLISVKKNKMGQIQVVIHPKCVLPKSKIETSCCQTTTISVSRITKEKIVLDYNVFMVG
jgi:hypothetical protein